MYPVQWTLIYREGVQLLGPCGTIQMRRPTSLLVLWITPSQGVENIVIVMQVIADKYFYPLGTVVKVIRLFVVVSSCQWSPIMHVTGWELSIADSLVRGKELTQQHWCSPAYGRDLTRMANGPYYSQGMTGPGVNRGRVSPQ